jgi:hypothetical protein
MVLLLLLLRLLRWRILYNILRRLEMKRKTEGEKFDFICLVCVLLLPLLQMVRATVASLALHENELSYFLCILRLAGATWGKTQRDERERENCKTNFKGTQNKKTGSTLCERHQKVRNFCATMWGNLITVVVGWVCWVVCYELF